MIEVAKTAQWGKDKLFQKYPGEIGYLYVKEIS